MADEIFGHSARQGRTAPGGGAMPVGATVSAKAAILWAGCASLSVAAFRLLRRWARRRRSRLDLAELSDRQLRDIGVARDLAMEEARKPFWR